jgi:hypothetical protein
MRPVIAKDIREAIEREEVEERVSPGHCNDEREARKMRACGHPDEQSKVGRAQEQTNG